jgi:hypothetical protein
MLGLRFAALKPSLDRHGTLRFPDGATYLAPKVTVLEPTITPLLPLELSGQDETVLEWRSKDLAAAKAALAGRLNGFNRTCKSGPCQHAHKPKCSCGCKGTGHKAALLRENHSITEWLEGTKPLKGAFRPPSNLLEVINYALPC